MTWYEWLNLDSTKLGIIFALLGVLYLLRDGELIEPPKKTWVLFRWLGFKEKRP